MHNFQWFLLAFLLTNGFLTHLRAAPSEIVVAIRYLQQTGASHAHLFLFREDGTVLRQLTKDDSGQDRNPVFAPDGETIVFTRELPDGVKQPWSVEPRGNNLHLLDAAPDWYRQTKNSPHFAYPEDKVDAPTPTPPNATRPVFPINDLTAVVLVPTADADKENPDEWTAMFREKNGHETAVGHVSGWMPRQLLCQESALQVAFIFTSLGSTDSATVYAVGPGKGEFARLARNWAAPFPLPGDAAFLTFAEERYVPFGDGSHTANCSYVDRWDAALKRVRYARKDAAAICNGASMYRPGKTPAVVTMLAGDAASD